MGQMFDNTRNQMNNWRWDNPHAFWNHVDPSNPQTTSSGKVKRTGERFSCYGSNDFRAKIEPPSCWQYKPGNFPAVTPLNWDEPINEDDDEENWAGPGVPSGGRSHPGDDNDNDNGEGETETQRGERRTGRGSGTKDGEGKGMATEDGKGNGKGKGNGNVNGKGIVEQTSGGDDISHAVALQLQRKCQRQTWTWRAN